MAFLINNFRDYFIFLICIDRLSGIVREHGDVGYLYCDGKGHSNSPTIQSLSNLPHEDYAHEQSSSGCQEITDIPDDYLNQSQVGLLQ